MSLLEELSTLGVDIEDGKKRLMGNVALYERMMGTFVKLLTDTSIQLEDFDCDDCTGIIKKTHLIKGAAGNLSIVPLYKAYSDIVALLRQNEPGKAKELYENILPVQAEIVDCINKY